MIKTLYRYLNSQELIAKLRNGFDHPGIILFRGRELMALNDYLRNHPLKLQTKVLDLGCGEGFIGSIIFNKIDYGLDIVKSDLDKAKKLSVYQKVILADAKKTPFKNNFFDLVFSNSVIEHIDGIDQVLAEVARILKPGGKFIFTVPSHKFSEYLFFTDLLYNLKFRKLAKLYENKRNLLLDHYNLFDHNDWKKKLALRKLSLQYNQYYLSKVDMHLWDIICISLRLSKTIVPLNRQLKKYFEKKVKSQLMKSKNVTIGAGLMIVVKK